MSSISVVHHPFSESTSDQQNSPFSFPYSSSEYGQEGPQSSSATFTINPASSRPPSTAASMNLKKRTPRTSLIGSNADRPGSVFDMPSYGGPSFDEKDEQERAVSSISRRSRVVRNIEVWREMFTTSNGRDKALVCHFRLYTLVIIAHTLLETDTVFYPRLSLLPCAFLKISSSTTAETLGGGHDNRSRESILRTFALSV